MKVGDLVQYAQDVHTGVYSSSDWGYGMVTEAYLEERTVEVFWPFGAGHPGQHTQSIWR